MLVNDHKLVVLGAIFFFFFEDSSTVKNMVALCSNPLDL